MLAAGGNSRATTWDPSSGEVRLALGGVTQPVPELTYSSDALLLASGEWDKTVRLWRLANWSISPKPEWKFKRSSDADGSVVIWDAQNRDQLALLHGHDNPVHRVAIDPTGKRVVSAGNDSTIRIWNARTHLDEWTLAGHAGSVHSGMFDLTGSVVASAGADMTLRIWNTEDGTLLHF